MSRREILHLLAIVVGLGLVVSGQFFVPRSGAPLFVAPETARQAEIGTDTPVVKDKDFPSSLQREFEQRLDGQTVYLGPEAKAHDAFPWEFYEIGYGHYQGAYFETAETVGHPTAIPQSAIVLLGAIVMTIGVAGGVGLGYRDRTK